MTDTTDNKNKPQATEEYAGPPKSTHFQKNDGSESVNFNDLSNFKSLKMPPKAPEDVRFSEEDILATPPFPNKNELLDIISEPDRRKAEEEAARENAKQQMRSQLGRWLNFQHIMAQIRRGYNEFKEKNAKTLRALNHLWIIAKFFAYLVGLSFFVVCFVFYFTLEPLLRGYLKQNHLNISFESLSYSLSELTVNKLKENNGLLTIDKIRLQYSFADLLSKKIPFAEVTGLKIYIQEGDTSTNTLDAFSQVLLRSRLFNSTMLFAIDSIRFENSVVYIGNKEYKLPVNFSGLGSLGAKKQIVFPFAFTHKFLTLQANATGVFDSGSSDWSLEIVKGQLTLPTLGKQDVKGSITLKTRKGRLSTLDFNGTLTSGSVVKKTSVQITPAGRRYNVKMTMNTPAEKGETIYDLSLIDVQINKDLTGFKTNSPISVKVTNYRTENFKADTIQFLGNGVTNCAANECSFKLTKNSDLVLLMPRYNYHGTEFSIAPYPLRLTFEPIREKAFVLSQGVLKFTTEFNPTSFTLQQTAVLSKPFETNIQLGQGSIRGDVSLSDYSFNANIESRLEEIKNAQITVGKGDVSAVLSDKEGTLKLSSNDVSVANLGYFKPDFKLKALLNSDYYFTADIETKNGQVNLSTNGYYHPYSNEVLMSIKTNKPIVFNETNLSPAQLSTYFSEDLKDVTGALSFKGRIHYKNARSISGPLQVLLDNVSFTYGNTKVRQLNSILNLTQLVPFGAQGEQKIYVRAIDTVLPFTNIDALVFFDASRKQFNLSSSKMKLAGYELNAEPMWYNYDAAQYSFSFNGGNMSLQKLVRATTVKDLRVAGHGAINLTLQLQDGTTTLKNFELSAASDTRIKYTPATYPSPYLVKLADAEFKRMSVFLSQQENALEIIFSADNKVGKRKTNFRIPLPSNLGQFIKPEGYSLPNDFLRMKEKF